ncbi:MAG: hypothetical protein RLZZ95_1455 [Pseudomonadota bacterium]|jgi:hypothetical protein
MHFPKFRSTQTIMSYRLPESRPTVFAALWLMAYLGAPLLLIGLLLDVLFQWATGVCVGVWCWF